MIKKQVFFAFKSFSPLKYSQIRQELFGCFFNRSNSLTSKRDVLLRKDYRLLCKSGFIETSFGRKTEKSSKSASLYSLTGTTFWFRRTSKALSAMPKQALRGCLVSEAVLAVNNLRKGKKEIICKFKSQRSGEILKEPFIDNFLTEVDQIAFGLTKKTQKSQLSVGPMSELHPKNTIRSPKQSLNPAIQKSLSTESKISFNSINLNKVSTRSYLPASLTNYAGFNLFKRSSEKPQTSLATYVATSVTPKGRIGTKYILANRSRKIGLTVTRLLASQTSKQEKQVTVDVKMTIRNQLKKSLDTKLLSEQVSRNDVSKRQLMLNTSRTSRTSGAGSAGNPKNLTWNSRTTSSKINLTSLPSRNQFVLKDRVDSANKAAFKSLPLKLASQKNSNKFHLYVKLGDYVNCGDKIGESGGTPLIVNSSGKIIKISNKQIILQKTQPVLYYSQANVHVKNNEWVIQGAPILTLTHQTLVTGDIVQGIPRIEQLFEAPNSPPPGIRGGHNLHQTLHTQIREIFKKNWIQAPLPTAVRLSLEQIQQILVESIQKVYLSQGVLIADKHVEIIVRQMSSKAEVLDGGNTGLLLEELLPVEIIENTNLATPGKKALYAPAVVGLTRSALESDSFISAASFQETTRVLSRDAIIGKSDFLRGLKEKVVIGDLISAGTGLDIYFVYTLLANTLAT